MKRLNYALAFLFFVQIGQSFSLKAQVIYTDTLGLNEYQAGSEVLYQSPNGGYVFGNNGYGDQAKVKTFHQDSCGHIQSVLFKFGAKAFNSAPLDSSRLIVRLYSLGGGAGVTTTGVDSLNVPSSELVDDNGNSFTTFIYLADIDTSGGYTAVNVPMDSNLDPCFSNFGVGLDFADLNPLDTVGLFSTTDGDAGLSETTWDLTSNGTWVTVLQDQLGWDLDVDPAIFPVFTFDGDSSLSITEIDQLRLQVYPNPTNGILHIKDAVEGELSIVDLTGRVLQKMEIQNSPKEEVLLDLSNFTRGTYLVRLVSENQILTAPVKVFY